MKKSSFVSGYGLFLLGLVIGIVLLDQVTKHYIVSLFSFVQKDITLTPFLNLTLTWNVGISFGMFNIPSSFVKYVLLILVIGITLTLVVWVVINKDAYQRLFLTFIIAGAIGNIIDRFYFGAVVDFIDVHVLGYHWPAFNIADAFISIGAILLFFNMIFDKGKR